MSSVVKTDTILDSQQSFESLALSHRQLVQDILLQCPRKKNRSTWVIQKQGYDNLYIPLFADSSFYRMRKDAVQTLPALVTVALIQMELPKGGGFFFLSQKKKTQNMINS